MTQDPFTVLRGLWEGDKDSYGYAHEAIVIECCELCPRYTEVSPQWVLNHLRSGYPKFEELDPEEQRIIEAGIKRWVQRGMPRKSAQKAVSGS